jgi:hypothetical protein
VLVAATAVVLTTRRRLRLVAAAVILVALAQPAWALRTLEHDGDGVATGVTLWQAGGTTVVAVEPSADPRRALEALRRAGVRRIDLAIAVTGGVMTGEVVQALDARYALGAIWAPVGHQVRGATTVGDATRARAGPFTVVVRSGDGRLAIDVRRAA